jgi:N-acetylglutamate synthase-like GNAT family acetyltransferase
MTLKIIKHLSPEYEQMVHLRITVLLQPLGIPASYIKPENEGQDLHLGAFADGVIIGCCVLTNKGNGQIQLRQMAVAAKLQGQRIGATILDFAEQTAREKGYSLLFMHARNPVIPFYKKNGYHIVGEEFFEVGIGHHRMEKELVISEQTIME